MALSRSLTWALIVLLCFILYTKQTALARALPSLLAGSRDSSSQPVSDPPPELANTDSSATGDVPWARCIMPIPINPTKEMDCHMISPDLPHKQTSVVLGRDSHLHTINIPESEDIPTPTANIFPCWIEHRPSMRRLRCKSSTETLRKAPDNSGIESLVAELLNGIPLSVGPQLPAGPGSRVDRYHHVLVYPFGGNLTLLLVGAKAQPQDLALADLGKSDISSRPLVHIPHAAGDDSTLDEDQSISPYEPDEFPELSEILHCWFQENKYETAAVLNCGVDVGVLAVKRGNDDDIKDLMDTDLYREQLSDALARGIIGPLIDFFRDASWERDLSKVSIMVSRTLMLLLAEVRRDTGLDIVDFDWTPVVEDIAGALFESLYSEDGLYDQDGSPVKPLTPGVIEWLQETILESLIELSDNGEWEDWFTSDGESDGETDSDTENCECHRRGKYLRREESVSGSMEDFSDRTLNEYYRKDPVGSPSPLEVSVVDELSHDTVVEGWFRCWNGSGSKLRCEIPDQSDVQSHHVRRDQQDTDGTPSPFFLPLKPLHLLPDSPRIRHNCNFGFHNGTYWMQCPIALPDHKLLPNDSNRKSQSAKAGLIPTFSKRANSSSDPIDGPRNPTPPQQTGPNGTAFSASQRCSRSPFGKTGDTFAFIGFFTVLGLFTIILSCVVKMLYGTLHDLYAGFEEWSDGCWRKKRVTCANDIEIDGVIDDPAPSYISGEPLFGRMASAVALPGVAVLSDVTEATASTTGSQAVEEGADTIKRKRAAARATLDEEQGNASVDD